MLSLHSTRGNIKAALTRFLTYMDSIHETQFDSTSLHARLAKAKETWSNFHDIQAQIAILEESENDQEEIIEFQETYCDAITQAEKILSSSSTSNIHNAIIKSEERLCG
ncbi:hypothetical protein Trydic_g19964 [Trypoxylus dichotomus]